jgi:hypothetical protein
LTETASSSACIGEARSSLLYRRARNGPKRTEHTAVARLGPQQRAAAAALVEEHAGIHGHSLGCLVSAIWAADDRLLDHRNTREG